MAVCTASLNFAEYSALYAFYNATNGADWRYNSSLPTTTHWHFPVDLDVPCSDQWQGLTCGEYFVGDVDSLRKTMESEYFSIGHDHLHTEAEAMCTVIQLELQVFHLHGQLPPELVNLTNLEVLELSGNLVTGSLPTELTMMSSLRRLSVGYNYISGSIPSEVGKMEKMLSLDVAFNFVNGSLPTSLSDIPLLTTVNLGANYISGSISDTLILSEVSVLLLDINKLTGTLPSNIDSQLPSIEVLWVFENNITGTLPPAIGSFPYLYELYMYNNTLSGTICSEIGQLHSSLLSLALEFNRFTGALC